MMDGETADNSVNTEAGNAQNQENTGNSNVQIDLSGLMMKDNPENFDKEKVTELYRNAEKWKADRQFFQSKYQQKVGIPEKIEDYGTNFKADSSYEKFMDSEGVKEIQQNLYKHAKENGIGVKEANSVLDFFLKTAIKSGDLDNRTAEQIKLDEETATRKFKETRDKAINPMLEGLHRTQEENNKILDNFINAKNNPLTKDPEMKQFLIDLKGTIAGEKLLTHIENMVNFGDVPVISGSIATKDVAAFQAKFNAEQNPEIRQSMLDEFYGREKK